MGVRNRGSYSSSSRARSGGMGLLKGFLVMCGLATLSFALGFFVLARLLPGNQKPEEARDTSVETASNSAPTPTNAVTAPPVSTPPTTTTPAPAAPPKPNTDTPGPVIEPLDSNNSGVQQPDSPDSPRQSDRATEPSASSERNPFIAIAPDTLTENAPAAPRRARRHRTNPTPDTGAIQTPAQPDGVSSPSATPDTSARPETGGATEAAPGTDTGTTSSSRADTSSASDSRRYRVQLGIFSTREKADEVAQAARDKGVRTYIRQYTGPNGQPLYRVQQGIYRNRARAEAARQRLTEAGIEAALSPVTPARR